MKRSYEYRNNFLYFVIGRDEERGKDAFVYCSGVNLEAFLPMTRGRHGLGSNPALRGLQLTNLDVRALILSRGATPKTLRGKACEGMTPATGGWYTEQLLIENATVALTEEVMNLCVLALVRKILDACRSQDAGLPVRLPDPGELQSLLESLCRAYGNVDLA